MALLQKICAHGDGEASQLLAEAENKASEDVSLHRHIDALNHSMQPAEKMVVMRAMWEVAFADNELHPWEEALLRRFADLLHLSHSEFIRCKLQVTGEI